MNPSTTARAYSVSIPWRGWTANAQRNMHFHKQAELVKQWRQYAHFAAVNARLRDRLDRVAITVETHLKGRRSQDIGANFPAVKAAIDGLVDAHVIPDDTPEFLVSLTFLAPVFGAAADEVTLIITEVVG